MADITTGYTWVSGETVTPGKLNQAVSDATITGIVNADIDAAAAISLSKLNLGTGISSSQIADGAVTGGLGGGKLAASAITAQTQKTSIAAADQFLIHSASDAALRRVEFSVLRPAGSVLQVQSNVTTSASNITSATIADSGIAALSMTRTTTTSKILLEVTGGRCLVNGYESWTYFYVSENAGAYADVASGPVEYNQDNAGTGQFTHTARYLYTPSTSVTSIAAKVYYKNTGGTTATGLWHYGTATAGSVPPFVFTMTEIA